MSSRTSSPENGVLAKWGGVHIQDSEIDAKASGDAVAVWANDTKQLMLIRRVPKK